MNVNVGEALNTVNQLIPLVDEAESQFRSARNWSIFDMVGGGMITDFIKHYKLGKAGDTMNDVNYLLQQLQVQLGNIDIPVDYRMRMGGFLTFADFFFDGFFVDAFMASKIFSSLDQVRKLKEKLLTLKSTLEGMR